jgi:hypothetical protein
MWRWRESRPPVIYAAQDAKDRASRPCKGSVSPSNGEWPALGRGDAAADRQVPRRLLPGGPGLRRGSRLRRRSRCRDACSDALHPLPLPLGRKSRRPHLGPAGSRHSAGSSERDVLTALRAGRASGKRACRRAHARMPLPRASGRQPRSSPGWQSALTGTPPDRCRAHAAVRATSPLACARGAARTTRPRSGMAGPRGTASPPERRRCRGRAAIASAWRLVIPDGGRARAETRAASAPVPMPRSTTRRVRGDRR